ncbi:MAG: hypothetical protein H6744_12495 [Deltaproteobacteria bacterium]|nr:hypothetical protein [Deltaproteobacteria bacterium]MCB9787491.1 hypothetical protein [Deltaproteobacteria bacterium]
MRLTVLIALGALLALPCAASAAELRTRFSGSDARVTDAHLAPALTSREAAVEKYLLEAYLEDGRAVYWSARLSNLGMGDGKVQAKSRISGKGMKKLQAKRDAKKGGYTAKGTPLDLTVGDHSLTGTPEKLRIQAEGDGYSFDLTFEAELKAWHPGAGRNQWSDGTYYDMTVLMPRAKVTGTVTIGGETATVSGYGYGIHTHGDVAPHEQAKRWVQLRKIDGSNVIYFYQFQPTDGSKPVSWLYFAHNGKVVITSTDVTVNFADMQPDTKSDKGYQVPGAMVIEAKSGSTKAVLAVKGKGKFRRTDELAKLSAVERALASKFASPVRYEQTAKYKAVVTGGKSLTTSGGGARFEVTQLNP